MSDREYAAFLLEQIKLLSALESWTLSSGKSLPDYLLEKLDTQMARLEKELLK